MADDMVAGIEQSRADALHEAAVVCDLTLPWGPGYANQDRVLSRFRASGIDFVSLTVGLDRMSLEQTIRHIAAERARFAKLESEGYVLVDTVDDILRAKREGKLALGFHFQGSNPLQGDPKMVGLYYRLGIRHMLFAYNQRNMAADGCHEDSDVGLSRFGHALVREMNRVGMIIDCTHTGHRSTMDILEASADPVMFSHSNAWSLVPHDRNIKDDQILACAAKGGLIGINGVGHFLSTDMVASPEAFFRHIDYMVTKTHWRHVCIGIDHVYYSEQMAERRTANPDTFPRGYPTGGKVASYVMPEDLRAVTRLMVDHGYPDEAVRGILGQNFLDLARRVWKPVATA
ncbi:membrane dipeptidase [Stella humosa]|uniref:Membrane dipeptidase n=2 Tax=Stella humosa TaxID=94 RepID=A0A3N1KKF8_9PROT|nr:membrane dipeptidase [Stella humosa]BBK32660.1 membrane dipeptidase [Stella humosa]